MQDARWWKQWGIDGVVLFWALPKYEPIARAIKQSGAKLAVYLDSGGLISPHVWLSMYLRTKCIAEKDEGIMFPVLSGFLKTVVSMLQPHHSGMISYLEHADILAIPSPLAKQRYNRYLIAIGRPDLSTRLHVIPYSIPEKMTCNASVQKKPIIIAVGGWHRLQKNPDLLVRVLGRALSAEPGYSARVIGGGQDKIKRLVRKLKDSIASQIEVLGVMSHEDLRNHYQESQISLCSSFYESFHLASAEALCCGCSVVGDARISSMPYFASFGSGTLACDLSLDNLSDALLAEIDAWRCGERDPVRISSYWTSKLHPEHAARKLLSLFGQFPAGETRANARG